MNLKRVVNIFIFILIFTSLRISAQTSSELTEALKGLKEMTLQEKNEMGSFKIKDPIVFFLEGKKLKTEEVKPILNDGEYRGTPYKNENGELRAIVFKKKSPEEIERKKNLIKKQ